MAALERGTTAPDFNLQAMDGKQFSLREALARGPVLAAFFKISCPTCQYALPFLQRIYGFYGRSDQVANVHLADEGHDYGPSKRQAMYAFLIKHLRLDASAYLLPDGRIDEAWAQVVAPERVVPVREV